MSSYFREHGASYVWSHPLQSAKALMGQEKEVYASAAAAVGEAVDSAANSIGSVVGAGVEGLISPLLGDWGWILLIGVGILLILAIVI